MKTGLVLGKFAPLHKGHQLLLDTALAENDRVVAVIYNAPETTSVPLPLRVDWIRKLYPTVVVYEAWDGPTEIGDTPEIRQMHEAYLLELLSHENIGAFYSSEFYGDHVSQALGAVDRRVDPVREAVPVSGTQIRKEPYAHRRFLHPIVYRDLITRVVFLGAPSTGKSTLAEALAGKHQTNWMPEYGREYWEAHQSDRRLTLEQLVEIALGHRVREEKLLVDSNRTLFVDTDATTTYMFSHYYHGAALPALSELADDAIRRYDLFFLCEPDIPYDDTWDRSGDANRQVFHQQIRADLLRRHVPFISLRGSLEMRMESVDRVLRNFDRYQSLGTLISS